MPNQPPREPAVADDLLAVSDGIERCAEVAADAIVATAPELSRDNIRRAMSQELWMAVTEVASLAATGAGLV